MGKIKRCVVILMFLMFVLHSWCCHEISTWPDAKRAAMGQAISELLEHVFDEMEKAEQRNRGGK